MSMAMEKLILKIEQYRRSNPTATMGFNVQFNYKALDFSMYTFASGNVMVREVLPRC
jgi:hypothetical protein